MDRTPTPASTMSSSTSSREGGGSGDGSRSTARSSPSAIPLQPLSSTSRPRTVYDQYHGDDSENEVEEELREREQDYGFRASRTRPFPSSSSFSLVRRSSPAIMTMRASSFHAFANPDSEMIDGTVQGHSRDSRSSTFAYNGSKYTVARLPTELYGLIASFILSERPIAKIHTFRKSPWRIVAGASVASRAMRAAVMHAWFRVLRIRQVGDFNFIDQKMSWMFPWVREIHWHYRFPITCNETHVLPKFIHAVLISFKTSDNRLGNEHYMTMVNKAMPYLGSIPTLTRLSLTCRSLFDPIFLSSLAECWPALECLRLARPLKDDNDMKAFILYRYDFPGYEDVVSRLVKSLGSLRYLAYIAIDLSFADYRAMRAAHAMNAPAPVLPRHITLPKSLQPPRPSPPASPSAMDPDVDGEGGSGSETDADGDTIMDDATVVGGPLANGMAAMHVSAPPTNTTNGNNTNPSSTAFPYAGGVPPPLGLPPQAPAGPIMFAAPPPLPANPLPSTAPDANHLAAAVYPTAHNPGTTNTLECPFCLRAFRAHSYYIEHEVAMGLGRGLPSLAAVRFRASFPQAGTPDAKENKWLIKRVNDGYGYGYGYGNDSDSDANSVQVWAPKWE